MLGNVRSSSVRAIVVGWQRPVLSCLLIALLAGGICPSFYGTYLTHDPFKMDRPPPAGWEHQEHPNPLLAYFQVSIPSSAPADHDGEARSRAAVQQPQERVISVYTGATMTVLSQITTLGLVPFGTLVRPGFFARMVSSVWLLPPLFFYDPPINPPRVA